MFCDPLAQYLCVFTVVLTGKLFLHCPRGFELGGVGKEQFGLGLLPEPHQPKVHTGHTGSHYGTLSQTQQLLQRAQTLSETKRNRYCWNSATSRLILWFNLTLNDTSTAKKIGLWCSMWQTRQVTTLSGFCPVSIRSKSQDSFSSRCTSKTKQSVRRNEYIQL